MAEAPASGKGLTCDAVAILNKMIEMHIKWYTEFEMDNVKEHEGVLQHCPHGEEVAERISQLIVRLETMKGYIKSHANVIDLQTLIRETPGRRNRRPVQPKVCELARDSGVGSTTSQDLPIKEISNIQMGLAEQGHIENKCSWRLEKNGTQARNNDHQCNEDFTQVDANSQTIVKTQWEQKNLSSPSKEKYDKGQKDN